MTSVAVLGTGRMGTAIAGRLLATGHHVTVWNRTPPRPIPGARAAPSPADAIRDADVSIVMVRDAEAVADCLQGVAFRSGSCLIQMSTIAPGEMRDLARRLPSTVNLIDAPVAGSAGAAASGGLTVLAGGESDAIDKARPVLEALGTVRHCGPIGAGAAVKLVLNTALVTAMAAVADAAAVGGAFGMGRAEVLAILRSSPLSGAVARAEASGASFTMALAAKDADLALRAAAGVPVPLLLAAEAALQAHPDQSADISALIPNEES